MESDPQTIVATSFAIRCSFLSSADAHRSALAHAYVYLPIVCTGVCKTNDRRYMELYSAIAILGRNIQVGMHIALYRYLSRLCFFFADTGIMTSRERRAKQKGPLMLDIRKGAFHQCFKRCKVIGYTLKSYRFFVSSCGVKGFCPSLMCSLCKRSVYVHACVSKVRFLIHVRHAQD